MRLFLALNLPLDERDRLQRAAGPLRAAGLPVRWVAADALHLTLKFLGEVGDARSGDVAAAVAGVASQFGAFSFELQGLGAFPNLRNPRVVWVGVHAPPELAQLARALEDAMAGLGFPREDRPFSPHLTLGRAERDARPRDFEALGRLAAGFDYRARIDAGSVDLMRSHLSPRGARYERIAAAALRAATGGTERGGEGK